MRKRFLFFIMIINQKIYFSCFPYISGSDAEVGGLFPYRSSYIEYMLSKHALTLQTKDKIPRHNPYFYEIHELKIQGLLTYNKDP